MNKLIWNQDNSQASTVIENCDTFLDLIERQVTPETEKIIVGYLGLALCQADESGRYIPTEGELEEIDINGNPIPSIDDHTTIDVLSIKWYREVGSMFGKPLYCGVHVTVAAIIGDAEIILAQELK